MPKFIVTNIWNSGFVKYEYYEADDIYDVYRFSVQGLVLSYIFNILYQKHFTLTDEMEIINEYGIGDDQYISEQEEEKYGNIENIGIQYINIGKKTLEELCHKHCTKNKKDNFDILYNKALQDEVLNLLSNDAIFNIFHYFNTPGGGSQCGTPTHEQYSCTVEYYNPIEPQFIILKKNNNKIEKTSLES